jgi:hypothetical protein
VTVGKRPKDHCIACKYSANVEACRFRRIGCKEVNGIRRCFVPHGALRIEDEREGRETPKLREAREKLKARRGTIYG